MTILNLKNPEYAAKYPYVATVPIETFFSGNRYSLTVIPELREWCNNNCKDEWMTAGIIYWRFASKEDAALFTLFHG